MKKNIFNSLIFGLPLIIMATTAAYFTYQINQQSQLLNDLAIVAETHQPVVNNKSELLDAFAKYMNAAGLKPESQKQAQQTNNLNHSLFDNSSVEHPIQQHEEQIQERIEPSITTVPTLTECSANQVELNVSSLLTQSNLS